MKIHDFYLRKQQKTKICMVTCYDYSQAQLLAETNIDCLLVGDSVAMVIHGYQNTLSATIEMMMMHVSAVARGAHNKFIIGDMPFLSYRQSHTKSVQAAQSLMQQGAHAVKLEGAQGNLKLIRHLVESGVPVMGHIGLTPQFIHQLGGFKAQGKTNESKERILADAKLLEEAGCFAIVLECIPPRLSKTITDSLVVPTIGVGAGPNTDGQVLVWHDLLGLTNAYLPKFVKRYFDGAEAIKTSINDYIYETQSGLFPHDEHCYQDC